MPIDVQRISRDIEAIAGFNESSPDIGYSRPTFSPAWRKARDYVIAEAESVGCKIRIDAAGNVHARPAKLDWEHPAWLSGSHIDSVTSGGKFDGVVGVVCPLDVLRAAREIGRDDLPLELIIFAEEEGTTFGMGMIGSRLWTGDATAESVRPFRNRDGQDYFQAGESHGVRTNNLATDRINPAHYLGMIEIHIEQGPAMWETNIPIALVTAIAGRKQFKIQLVGQANHAGSTPMSYRIDALAAAAKIITGVESMARDLSPQT
ncbi:MAG TPA: hydantoinase/carbamoylase family amidase, partial [Tepidisphaeraceae bacterium]|nr:hydantoinase/carbamoylase family amidase [Tepidisphaeraceae bacterium]